MLHEDLIDLPHHQRVQATLNAMAGDGIDAAAVAEAAFTVALAAKLQADGLEETIRQILIVARQLSSAIARHDGGQTRITH
ncbi:hypothetical protein ASG40_17300 [Methylobacterium sp. Leaf399]|uniref:hypothetical protein n=1 Tax=Methylobacterium sp. Leaf399 TaxID=1736364 RepID=UPI0007010CA1|nr:hypothetical protein [Methylobacterium sp. Leaf399]KQT17767.1 hypothetical protein ASG40_17300 [Methylobacterium sp. Leaf399]